MKKTWKALLPLLVTILIVITILIMFVIYVTEIRITDIAEFVNEKNGYRVVFQSVGEPDWPFGDTKIKVTLLNEKDKKVYSFLDYVSDDGGVASEGNIKVNWYNEYVEIVLMGEEQEDDIHKLVYK